MQNVERFLGFKIEIDDALPPNRLSSLKERALLIADRLELDPDEHHVYIHSLCLTPNAHTFLKGTKLTDRLDSLVIGFWVNQKQERNQKIRLMNHLFRDVLEPAHQFATYHGVQYTLSAAELEKLGTFSNEIVTFVHRSLPIRHRKLKVAILARPNSQLQLRTEGGITTRIDLRYERFTPIRLPKRQRQAAIIDTSPRFVWRGSSRMEDLHSFLQPEQQYYDVGELTRMVERSRAVCRVEIPEGQAYGTGVLIKPDLVLTNFHVLAKGDPDASTVLQAAQDVVLRFGAVTDETGAELPGDTVRLDPERPIVEASPTKDLDFVLLRLERPIGPKFPQVPYSLSSPKPRDTLSILQYPLLQRENNPLKVTLKPNAVTGIYPASGRIQYVTYATHGSSGAPCFDGKWEMVALHRAEQSVPFGTRREGVLFSSIHRLISSYLETANA